MPETAARQSLGDRAMKAGVWMTSIQVGGKALGLIRSVVLARLLAPDDFGLFGITAAVLSMITRFSNAGLHKAIVQKHEDVRGYLDSVWTFNLLRVTVLGAGLTLAAPWIAAFFEEPAAEPLVRVLGLALFIQGLISPALVLLPRDLEYRRRFIFVLSGVVSDLAISIFFAFTLGSAWALMLGFLGSLAVQLVVSYIVAPYRPSFRLDVSKLLELGRYGRWVFINQVLFFLAYRADNFLVGKVFGAAGLGIYIMAYAMSEAAVTQIGTIVTNVAFPTFARAQKDLDRVRRGFLTTVEWVFDLAYPSAIATILCAQPMANLVLGSRWAEVATVLPFLAIASTCRTMVMIGNAVTNGLGRPDLSLRMTLIIVVVTFGLYFPLVNALGMRGVGVAVMSGQLVTLPVYARLVGKLTGTPAMEMVRRLVPGTLLGIVVGAVLLLGHTGEDPWRFAATVVAAGLAYAAVALVMWRARHAGPILIIERLRAAYGK